MATPEFFEVLGDPALFGRTLTEDDAKSNPGTPPAVLSYGFWRRRFSSDPEAVGRTIVLHGHPFVIVGVMPRAFNGTSVDTAPDVRVPLHTFQGLWTGPEAFNIEEAELDLGGRLESGVTRAQAQAETLAIWRTAIEPYSMGQLLGRGVFDQLQSGMELDPLERGISILRERYAGALKLLLTSVGLLLLMVCANVTGLLLTRVAGRREEIAVRLAMGATRGRLVRQMITESFLLTGLGAAGGVLLAFVLTGSMVRVLPPLRDIVDETPRAFRRLWAGLARPFVFPWHFGADRPVLRCSTRFQRLAHKSRRRAPWRGVEWRLARSTGGPRLSNRSLYAPAQWCGSPDTHLRTVAWPGCGLRSRPRGDVYRRPFSFRLHSPAGTGTPCCAEQSRARDTRRRRRLLRCARRDARPRNWDDRGAGGPARRRLPIS